MMKQLSKCGGVMGLCFYGPFIDMAIPLPDRMNKLWEFLDKAGVSQKVMRKIAHENFLGLLPAN